MLRYYCCCCGGACSARYSNARRIFNIHSQVIYLFEEFYRFIFRVQK